MENLHGCDLQGTWNRIKSVRILRVNLGAKYARHRLPVEWKLGKHGPRGASKDCQDQLWTRGRKHSNSVTAGSAVYVRIVLMI